MPEKLDECVESVLEENPDYSESRAWAICNAQFQGLDPDNIEAQALSDVVGDLDLVAQDENPCWDGYVMVGTKTVDGREVPNCVPEEDAEPMDEQAGDEQARIAANTVLLERELDRLANAEHSAFVRESSDAGIAWIDTDSGAVIYQQDSYTDYPEAASENAQMALDAREDTGNPNNCGRREGWMGANQLANGEAISRDTVGRMAAFDRHRQNSDMSDEEGRADCGWMMWKAWGGDEGIEWAADIVDEEDTSEEQLDDDLDGLKFSDEAKAERVARDLGCSGTHGSGDEIMPCSSHDALLEIISNGQDEQQSERIVVEGLSQEGRQYIEQTYSATTAVFQEEIPDEAVNIQDRSEAPEDAEIITGERGGLYYVPENGDGENGGSEDVTNDLPVDDDAPESVDVSNAKSVTDLSESSVDGGRHANDMRIAEKQDGSRVFLTENMQDFEVEASIQGAEAMQEAGANAPEHYYYQETDELAVEGVNGDTIAETDVDDINRDSLVDTLTTAVVLGNSDMNEGNLVVDDDGEVHAIDLEDTAIWPDASENAIDAVNFSLDTAENNGIDGEEYIDEIKDKAEEIQFDDGYYRGPENSSAVVDWFVETPRDEIIEQVDL